MKELLMPRKFVIKKSSGGYHFNLLATNGKVIASSEHYESRAAAIAASTPCGRMPRRRAHRYDADHRLSLDLQADGEEGCGPLGTLLGYQRRQVNQLGHLGEGGAVGHEVGA